MLLTDELRCMKKEDVGGINRPADRLQSPLTHFRSDRLTRGKINLMALQCLQKLPQPIPRQRQQFLVARGVWRLTCVRR